MDCDQTVMGFPPESQQPKFSYDEYVVGVSEEYLR
jgi:hypothetical protein